MNCEPGLIGATYWGSDWMRTRYAAYHPAVLILKTVNTSPLTSVRLVRIRGLRALVRQMYIIVIPERFHLLHQAELRLWETACLHSPSHLTLCSASLCRGILAQRHP